MQVRKKYKTRKAITQMHGFAALQCNSSLDNSGRDGGREDVEDLKVFKKWYI